MVVVLMVVVVVVVEVVMVTRSHDERGRYEEVHPLLDGTGAAGAMVLLAQRRRWR